MRIVIGADEARRTILRRVPLDEWDVPDALRERDTALFGERLPLDALIGRIIAEVRAGGDAAVRRFNQALDGSADMPVEVPREEIGRAYAEVPADVVEALRLAASRVRAYHERQLAHNWRSFHEDGLGQVVRPLRRVGVYMPGTAVVYPSSVLHTVVPARVAGVKEVVLAGPAGASGAVHPLKLVAADIAGVDRVFRASGAQGIAALAYGTESVSPVDKICGPGSLFVTLAKRRVYGVVGVDALYGPTETVVVADESADPRLCAADLLAQAEHDVLASPVLLTDSLRLARAVQAEVDRQIGPLERGHVARQAFDNRGGAVVTASIDEAVELANEFAPEHLCLLLRDPWRYADLVRNAGGLFVGESSPEALGDYIAGPSHAMPTGGCARFQSPLSVNDFLRIISVVAVDESTFERLAPAAARIARAEGLTAHARALEMRLEGR